MDALVSRIAAAPKRGRRRMVAVAGPPAAGKSTFSSTLADALGARLVPMDGFHLDDRILTERGLLPRKGAPETYDAAGFVHAMRRLASGEAVILPDFDRSREISIAGALEVAEDVEAVVIEGNWLLLATPPWNELDEVWDASLLLDVPESVLRARLMERWRGYGFDEEAATAKTEGNDLMNARRMLAESREPTLIWRTDAA